jgi:malonyl-CoA O-methyltransferase
MIGISKVNLAERFGKAAPYYHRQAQVQRYAADRLLDWIETAQIPPGKILELGCGTGFLSQGLVQLFPQNNLEITDLSPGMVQFCQQQLSLQTEDFLPPRETEKERSSLHFYCLDAEKLGETKVKKGSYSLIASSFALQWFANPIETLLQLLAYLNPQGSLVLAFPSDHSFPEWKQHCHDRQVPCTLNPLPEFKAVVEALHRRGVHCEFRSEWYSESYPNFKTALQHLKALGAGLTTNRFTLSPQQLKQLLYPSNLPEITLSYHLVLMKLSLPRDWFLA